MGAEVADALEACRQRLLAIAGKRVHHADVEDVVQEALAAAWARHDEWPEAEKLCNWIEDSVLPEVLRAAKKPRAAEVLESDCETGIPAMVREQERQQKKSRLEVLAERAYKRNVNPSFVEESGELISQSAEDLLLAQEGQAAEQVGEGGGGERDREGPTVVRQEAAKKALRGLHPDVRRLLELVFIERKSVAEAAREMGMKPKEAEYEIKKARHRLRPLRDSLASAA